MFFVATAPLSADGLINCSPQGMDTFRVGDSCGFGVPRYQSWRCTGARRTRAAWTACPGSIRRGEALSATGARSHVNSKGAVKVTSLGTLTFKK